MSLWYLQIRDAVKCFIWFFTLASCFSESKAKNKWVSVDTHYANKWWNGIRRGTQWWKETELATSPDSNNYTHCEKEKWTENVPQNQQNRNLTAEKLPNGFPFSNYGRTFKLVHLDSMDSNGFSKNKWHWKLDSESIKICGRNLKKKKKSIDVVHRQRPRGNKLLSAARRCLHITNIWLSYLFLSEIFSGRKR